MTIYPNIPLFALVLVLVLRFELDAGVPLEPKNPYLQEVLSTKDPKGMYR